MLLVVFACASARLDCYHVSSNVYLSGGPDGNLDVLLLLSRVVQLKEAVVLFLSSSFVGFSLDELGLCNCQPRSLGSRVCVLNFDCTLTT